MTVTADPVVRTKAGELRGAVEVGVTVFRAVPYAAPPTGELRFAPPQPVPAWQGVRDATKKVRSRRRAARGSPTSWAISSARNPRIASRSTSGRRLRIRQSVRFWSGFTAARSRAVLARWLGTPATDFAANGDVVAVSINYRLGALGFFVPARREPREILVCSTRSRRCVSCATTSRPSAAIRTMSRSSASRPALRRSPSS